VGILEETMRGLGWIGLGALMLSGHAFAGSISAPGVIGGPESGAATSNAASMYYNPATLAPMQGVHSMLDMQVAAVRIDFDATRNDGIDPNTGECYETATARVVAPVSHLGITTNVIPDRLTVGLGFSTPFLGGGDYTSTEKGEVPPYKGSQRYHAINTKVITAQVTTAVGVTLKDWLHLGAGFLYTYDLISVLKASDPLGTEGVPSDQLTDAVPANPYTTDVLLEGTATGHHLGWNLGFLLENEKGARLGGSYTSGGLFSTEGEGSVRVPEFIGGVTVPALLSVEMPLPAVVRLYGDAPVSKKWNVGAGVDYYLWNQCCGDPDGDIIIGITNQAGNAIGPDDGVTTITIDDVQYSPRRLWNSLGMSGLAGYQHSDKVWLGGRLGYNQNAVPDYAVGPSNLDFTSFGFMLGARYHLMGPATVGLSYSKFFLQTRNIVDSAWNLGDGNERFTTELPYTSSTNGVYSGAVDIVGVRVQMDW